MPESQFLDPRALSPEIEHISRTLRSRVVGQTDAIEEIVRCFVRFKSGLRPQDRPLGVFLLAGPTGVGKSMIVEEFARVIGHDPARVLKIECGEYRNQHETAKLIGSPPGYLGHRETTPIFTQPKLDNQFTPEAPLSIVLFDELEKAHSSLHDMLLGVLDRGTIRLGDNSPVDFRNSIIFMTTNLGAAEISNALAPSWGLGSVHADSAALSQVTIEQLQRLTAVAAARVLRPEFVNRIDRTITFRALSRADVSTILDMQIENLENRLALAFQPLSLTLTAAAKNWILAEGFNPKYGARHLKRAVYRNLEEPIANLLVSGQIKPRAHVQISLSPEDTLEFREL